jgi:hypothetical protein
MFTLALFTPSSFLRAFSVLATQDAQCMPVMPMVTDLPADSTCSPGRGISHTSAEAPASGFTFNDPCSTLSFSFFGLWALGIGLPAPESGARNFSLHPGLQKYQVFPSFTPERAVLSSTSMLQTGSIAIFSP